MEFGVVLQPNPPASGVVAMMKRAERAGFGYGWTFDSHVLWQETFLLYPRILAETTAMTVGPMVTNPGTRDWSVLASMFATLTDSYGDRVICGIGRGDSALRVLGLPPASLGTLSDAVTVIKGLAEGREVIHHGRPLRLPWVRPGSLPVWMAGYGPKALRLAGERADGFILQTADPDIARWTFAAVRAAASAAGRDPASITMCVAAPAYVGDDLPHQRSQLRWFGGMVGNHVADLVARYGTDGPVPRALTDYIAGREAYDYAHHGRAGNPSADFVPDTIVDRFCLLGPVSAHVDRLRELAEIGADQFAIYLMHDAPEKTLDAYGEKIIPALRGLPPPGPPGAALATAAPASRPPGPAPAAAASCCYQRMGSGGGRSGTGWMRQPAPSSAVKAATTSFTKAVKAATNPFAWAVEAATTPLAWAVEAATIPFPILVFAW